MRVTSETSGRAVLFVALAVSAGFGINIPSNFYGIRLMGLFVPVPTFVSCLTALTLLPALVLPLRPRFIFSPGTPRNFVLLSRHPRMG